MTSGSSAGVPWLVTCQIPRVTCEALHKSFAISLITGAFAPLSRPGVTDRLLRPGPELAPYVDGHDAERYVAPLHLRPARGADHVGQVPLRWPLGDGLGQVLIRDGVAGHAPGDRGEDTGQVAPVKHIERRHRDPAELAYHEPPARPGDPVHLLQRGLRLLHVAQSE